MFVFSNLLIIWLMYIGMLSKKKIKFMPLYYAYSVGKNL
jgi:hypothetical protein